MTPLLDAGFVEGALRRHFQTLLEPEFAPLLAGAYRHGIRFEVNDRLVEPEPAHPGEYAPIEVRLARKRKPSASRPVERDLERVLLDLADELPLLSAIVDRREGGQRSLPMGRGSSMSGQYPVSTAILGRTEGDAPIDTASDSGSSPMSDGAVDAAVASQAASAGQESHRVLDAAPSPLMLPGVRGPRRPARYGLEIQFDRREDDPELGRLVDSRVWVNEAHPAFARAAASRSEGYHVALSVAMVLAPLAVEPQHERAFVTSFLEQWGEAVAQPGKRRR